MNQARRTKLWLLTAAALGLFAGCSADEPATEWGTQAEVFFAEWDEAWSSADPYAVVRFYDLDVAVGLAQDYRSLSLVAGYEGTAVAGEGRSWLARWIDKQVEPRHRTLEDLYLGGAEAVAMVAIDDPETAVAVAMAVGDTSIVAATDLRWRDAHLPGGAPDDRLLWLDDLAEAYLSSWTTGGQALDALYLPEARVEAFPLDAIELAEAVATPELTYGEATIRVLVAGERSGPALFVGPDSVAIGLAATRDDGCQLDVMILLTVEDQLIAHETRLLTPDSVRRCYGDEAPDEGWWISIDIPPPVDEQVSGSITAADGSAITIINGTPELERLLEWGLGRFEATGLQPPRIASVTFGPVPTCGSIAGLVTATEHDSSDVILCIDVYETCLPDRASCTDFRATDRLSVAHELGHAWLLDNLSEDNQTDFLMLNDLASWGEATDAWHQRGAEHAAETVAWGLLETPISLVRIGEPPCEKVAAGFELLTGSEPKHACE